MLSSAEVLALRFPTSRMFGSGYNADAVDLWLDGIVRTLRAYEGEADGNVELLAEDAREVRFTTSRGGSAYATDAVDDAIDRIVSSLDEHERSA